MNAAVAMVTVGVRQWRFAPGPRRRSVIVLLITAAVLALTVPTLARDGFLGTPVVVAVLMLIVLLTARTPAARARAATLARESVEHR